MDAVISNAFDKKASKKPTNVSVNSDLLRKAKSLKINLSATLEAALVQQVQEHERAQWLRANKQAIASYNDFVEEHGCFGDGARTF